ncbi:MAG TPA: hypothetical protein PKZ01_11360 [Candidatus Hydrogenedentes bacterium]|nr:hypothetical protein [Candidatus Hydrogenedentota bacterium]
MAPERRKQLLLAVALMCMGAFAFDRLALTPGLVVWNERSARILELEKNIAESDGLLQRETALKERWESMKGRSLPARVSDAESTVLQSVGRWAGDSGLSVTSLKPRWNRLGPMAQTLEFQLEGSGNMESVAKFLYALETDPLPLKVEDMLISAQDDQGDRLVLSARFSALVLEETSP